MCLIAKNKRYLYGVSAKQVAANSAQGRRNKISARGVIEVPSRVGWDGERERRKERGTEDIHTLSKFSIGDSIAWNNLLINYNWNE